MQILVFWKIDNSAFLFSTARNKDNNPTQRINHGERFNAEATKPEKDLNKKPDEIQNKSKSGLFLSCKQYASCIKK